MTDSEYAEIQQRITPLVEKWVKILGLGWWKWESVYYRSKSDFADGGYLERATARCHVAWEYADISIRWNCERLQELEYNTSELESVVVHELCHALVSEMRMYGNKEMESEKYDEALKHEERVVTQLQKAFVWVWEAAYKAGQSEKGE